MTTQPTICPVTQADCLTCDDALRCALAAKRYRGTPPRGKRTRYVLYALGLGFILAGTIASCLPGHAQPAGPIYEDSYHGGKFGAPLVRPELKPDCSLVPHWRRDLLSTCQERHGGDRKTTTPRPEKPAKDCHRCEPKGRTEWQDKWHRENPNGNPKQNYREKWQREHPNGMTKAEKREHERSKRERREVCER